MQYARWTANAITGDLGTSFRSGERVFGELVKRLPATLQLTLPAFLVSLGLALVVGVISAVKRNSLADHGSRVAALVGDSVASFVLAYLLIIVFSVSLRILPVAGRGTWQHLVLPSLTLALAATASLMRLTRSSRSTHLAAARRDLRRAGAVDQLRPATRRAAGAQRRRSRQGRGRPARRPPDLRCGPPHRRG